VKVVHFYHLYLDAITLGVQRAKTFLPPVPAPAILVEHPHLVKLAGDFTHESLLSQQHSHALLGPYIITQLYIDIQCTDAASRY